MSVKQALTNGRTALRERVRRLRRDERGQGTAEYIGLAGMAVAIGLALAEAGPEIGEAIANQIKAAIGG